ncbi:MAG TPA: hypothetical protein VEL79_03125 [Vicinamibacterales bacterium]|nr:hypothetical protein [Vicinamibacterales bacterium]
MIDRYTKGVLTVIAGCLLWLCATTLGPAVSAQTAGMRQLNGPVQPVVIVGTGTMDQQGVATVNFERPAGAGNPRTDPTLPVRLPYTRYNPMPSEMFYTSAAPLPIEIAAVKKTGDWEPIRAHVEDAPARNKPGGGGGDRHD